MEKCQPEIGDIIFVLRSDHGLSWLQKTIRWVTKGPAFHVSMYAGDGKVFETDGAYGKAKFFDLGIYKGHTIDVYRMALLTADDKLKIQDWCKLLEGTPYSYWDIFIKLITARLFNRSSLIGGWIQEKFGTEKFMICNELVMYILYHATNYAPFKHSEEWNPSAFRKLCQKLFPEVFNVVY